MEPKFFVQNNGQQVINSDLDLLGETSALADDRVLAELFRLKPYDGSTVSRGILTYGHQGSATTGLAAPNGASGSILVYPFRAIIGSRTAVASNAKANLRDVRSSISVGTSTLAGTVAIAANASGNPRIDLVYAQVALDASDAGVVRKIKNPTSKVIAGATVTITKSNTVTLDVVEGAPSGSPAIPALPADAGDNYYIPIAYVYVPNGFNAGSTVSTGDLAIVAPVLTVAPAVGASSMRLANAHQKVGLSGVQFGQFGLPQNFAPAVNGVGCETLAFYVDLTTGSVSHTNGAIIDDSRDWRKRICRWSVVTEPSGAGTFYRARGTMYGGSVASSVVTGHGTTFEVGTIGYAIRIDGQTGVTTNMANGSEFCIDVDSNGRLILNYSGAPNCAFMVWLDLSGPFAPVLGGL